MLQRTRAMLAIVLAYVLSPGVAWSLEWRFEDVNRIVAIADIHGAYDALAETLRQSAVIDADGNWSGGDTHLVVAGDMIDRGPGSRAVMDLMMRLEGEAEAAGGRVHVLIGNHETMPMTGDMRYVSGAEYQAFAADEDAAERERWFSQYHEKNGGDAALLRERFDKEFPPGYFAMRRAFRHDGYYGEWLLQKNIIVVINGTAFVHGGLPPLVTEIGLQGINGTLKDELFHFVRVLGELTDAGIIAPTDSHYDYENILRNYLPALSDDSATLQAVKAAIRLNGSDLFDADGPLWYRENVVCPGIIAEYQLDAALAAIGATRVVVGHTPTPNRKVLQRFDGRLIEIDTGMLNFYYKGSGNALLIEGETTVVIGQASDARSLPIAHPRRVGRRAGSLSTAKLEELLRSGELVSEDVPDAGEQLRVQQGETGVRVVFTRRKGRGFYPGVAAYRLDRMLELDMVPVAVKRVVDGKDGYLQFIPEDTLNEGRRSAAGLGGDATCPLPKQWSAMYLFDTLIYNEVRLLEQMNYDRFTWQLILSDHESAFSTRKGQPARLAKAPLVVTAGWRNALSRLNDEQLQERLGDVLDKRQIRALGARRDELLAIE